MNQVYHNSLEKSKIALTNFTCADGRALLKDNCLYKIIWAKEAILDLSIDGCTFKLEENQMVFCTPLNIMDIPLRHNDLMSIVFNREFYCIHDNDIEIACNGFLFYGSSSPVIVNLEERERDTFKTIYDVLTEEFEIRDTIQGAMLLAMLKRLLIKSTRLAKKEILGLDISQKKVDLIRHFNVLVEEHFKTHHKVTDYAALLFKSPKTLANTFSKYSDKTPLSIIHERILLEARRSLLFSEKTVYEIAYELGFKEESHFSKFFTKSNGCSPLQFKKRHLEDKKREQSTNLWEQST